MDRVVHGVGARPHVLHLEHVVVHDGHVVVHPLPEGSLGAADTRQHLALDDDLGLRNGQIEGGAAHEGERLTRKGGGEIDLRQPRVGPRGSRQHHGGRHPDEDGHGQRLAQPLGALLHLEEMAGGAQAETQLPVADHLHAVIREIRQPRLEVPRRHDARGDVRARVLLAVRADGQPSEARGLVLTRYRLRRGQRRGMGEPLRPDAREIARLDTKRRRHAGVAAARVADDGQRGALHALEQHGLVPALLDVADQGGHLEARIDFLPDPDQLAPALEPLQKITETLDHVPRAPPLGIVLWGAMPTPPMHTTGEAGQPAGPPFHIPFTRG